MLCTVSIVVPSLTTGIVPKSARDDDGHVGIIHNRLEVISRRKYVASHDIAAIYAGLGERSKTLGWLNKAYDERSYTVLQLGVEPEFDSLRSDSRFQDLLHRIGLQR